MCGIVGIINKNGEPVNGEIISMMTDRIIHRGPDAGGIFCERNIGLGHRRLSIIDLSSHGNQPMKSDDSKYYIVYNGEVYNYQELRNELIRDGVVFNTQTDTEVILKAYEVWGTECFRRFNGMWSLCIFDKFNNRIVLSRDRFGVKPLYIMDRTDCFAFGSEIKCLTGVFPEEKKVDLVQLARYLRGVQEDCDTHTFYEGIKNFPVSSFLSYDLSSNKFDTQLYWKIEPSLFDKKWTTRKAIKTCRELIKDSIGLRLRADVPVGASLSGGLDSSTIVELVRKEFGFRMHTFSSVYQEKEYDEKEFIDCVNEDAESMASFVCPSDNEDILEDMKKMLYYHDNPLAAASPYSGFNVYRKAKGDVKVLLDGQGADEIFAGYYYFLNDYIENMIKTKGIRGRIDAIREISIWKSIWSERRIISDSIAMQVLGVSLFKKYDKSLKKQKYRMNEKELFSESFRKIGLNMHFPDEQSIPDGLLRRQYHEMLHGELPRILHDVDRNSMAHSLEVRLPFLDYRMVEFAFSLPNDMKYRNGWTKYVLRLAARPYLPHKIWSRRNKMGFPAPFEKWMCEDKYRDKIKYYLVCLGNRGVVNSDYLLKLFEDQLMRRINNPNLFFRFVMLEMWLQSEIDKNDKKWHLQLEV